MLYFCVYKRGLFMSFAATATSKPNKLENYITGNWITGDGDGQTLHDAVTGNSIATATTKGLDFSKIVEYGRTIGNPALRKLTFHERGRMLKALALHLVAQKEKFYKISYHTGATKADGWIDIEGGIGNLFSNASLRRKFPDLRSEERRVGKECRSRWSPYH